MSSQMEEKKETTTKLTDSRRVFVGNLSWATSWQNLKDHMRTAGNVVYADVFRDNYARSKGCGIVEYETSEEAERAIRELNDTELDNRKIFVREDREDRGFKSRRQFASRGGRGGRQSNPNLRGKQLFVGNLSFDAQLSEITDLFKKAGKIVKAEIAVDRSGKSRGYATVLFEKREDAQKAIEMFDQKEFLGRPLNVYEDRHV